MEPSKDQKEYQQWYYENVTKPKRAARNPDRKQRAPKRKLGQPTARNCEYPACGKEYFSNKPEKHYCSKSCAIKHKFDIKHGVTREKDEDYCPKCKEVYHISRFPVDKSAVSGRLIYCFDCQRERVRQTNKKAYKEDPTRFLEAQKRLQQRKRILTHASKAPWAGNSKKSKQSVALETNQSDDN